MECPACKETTSGIIEESSLWCDRCGSCIRMNYEYVTGFQNSHAAPRQQVYCRAKRFTKYIQSRCMGLPTVMQHIYDIVDLYSTLEFSWCCNRVLSKRIYFFAKPVMLRYCCVLLQVTTEGLPSLKDRNREITQFKDLVALTETPTFRAHKYL